MLCLLSDCSNARFGGRRHMAVQDPTRTIAAEQLVFSVPLLLACLAGLYFGAGRRLRHRARAQDLAGTFAAPRRPRLKARPGSAWAP